MFSVVTLLVHCIKWLYPSTTVSAIFRQQSGSDLKCFTSRTPLQSQHEKTNITYQQLQCYSFYCSPHQSCSTCHPLQLFPCMWGFLENVWQFIFYLHFFSFFFKVEIRMCTLIPLFRPESVHSGSASWDDCGRVFSDDLRVSLFPERFPHTPILLGQGGIYV